MNNHIRTKTFLILALGMLALLLPAAVFAEEAQGHGLGHNATQAEVYQVPGGEDDLQMQESYPASLDPRNEAWYTDCIRVRNQENSNLCWAFASTTAAQISYAKETKSYVEQGSPVHLGYFLYNRVNDPLGNTGGDKNLPVLEDNWFDEGGSVDKTLLHMATWSGIGPESNSPFIVSGGRYVGPMSLDSSLAYDDYLVEENSTYYRSLKYDSSGINRLKAMLTKYGAAVVSLQFSDWRRYLDPETAAYYKYDDYKHNDHEVVVVGWDDDYPEDNFYSEGYRPEGPGAWIVMNSWGDEESWPEGDDGYFYVSYESEDILRDGICSFDMKPADPSSYHFQYDGNAGSAQFSFEKGEKAANVYRAPSDQQVRLTDFSMVEYNSGTTSYTIEIYTSVDPKRNPVEGLKAASFKVSTNTPGYKTFALPKPIVVDPGEYYSVVVRYHGKILTGAEVNDRSNGEIAKFAKNQSFYYMPDPGKWFDNYANSQKFTNRIKATGTGSSCDHELQKVRKVAAAKGVKGYTLYKCSVCGHLQKKNLTKAKTPTPKKTSLKGLTKKRKAIVVKWKKSNEIIAGEHIDSYQIRYCSKSSMKGAKKKTIEGYRETSKTIKGLKAKRKYYVQVRTCYYDRKAGKTRYSSWSAKKSVKTK